MPSENDVAPGTAPAAEDRRTRKRDARREHLLDLAADLVEEQGVDGVTMAALAEVADYAPASLYTYFSSRSALLVALQTRALNTLRQVADERSATWDAELAELDPRPSAPVTALARLCAFSDLFLTAPEHHPREFRLQQQLLVTPGTAEVADAATVVPAAMGVLDVPRRLLAAAEDVGALAHEAAHDPIDQPVDGALVRTLAWIVALNGALLADRLKTGLPTTAVALGDTLTDTLLRGWGAESDDLIAARELTRNRVG